MKRVCASLLFVGGFLAGNAGAESVGLEDAVNVAKNFGFRKKGESYKVKSLKTDKELLGKSGSDDATFRLLRLEPAGWVMVAGEDTVTPVLAYSLEKEFNETAMPPQVRWLLKGYDRQVTVARQEKGKKAGEKEAELWQELNKEHTLFVEGQRAKGTNVGIPKRGISTRSTFNSPSDYRSPMLTTTWDQGDPYNVSCPGTNGSHTKTGCTATAMAQIMRYHGWPDQGEGFHSYDEPNFNTLEADFGNTYYNFNLMPSQGTLTGFDPYVAQLMFDLGVSLENRYGYVLTTSTNGRIEPTLKDHFRYWEEYAGNWDQYPNPDDWHEKVKNSVRRGFPVLYHGEDGVDDGHDFVIDGFDSEGGNEYHMNFGWSGESDGWYTLPDNGTIYTENQSAIFNIKPRNGVYLDKYEPDDAYNTASYAVMEYYQKEHRIDPGSDTDWIRFFNDVEGLVKISTISTNSTDDTEIWLYDWQGTFVAYDDDGGDNKMSEIYIRNLKRGRYYLKVVSGGQAVIEDYEIYIRY